MLSILALPIISFGAFQTIKQLEAREYVASIYTYNQENIFVYRVEDSLNPDVKCYITVNDKTRSNTMSCVNAPVVPVVKK